MKLGARSSCCLAVRQAEWPLKGPLRFGGAGAERTKGVESV